MEEEHLGQRHLHLQDAVAEFTGALECAGEGVEAVEQDDARGIALLGKNDVDGALAEHAKLAGFSSRDDVPGMGRLSSKDMLRLAAAMRWQHGLLKPEPTMAFDVRPRWALDTLAN